MEIASHLERSNGFEDLISEVVLSIVGGLKRKLQGTRVMGLTRDDEQRGYSCSREICVATMDVFLYGGMYNPYLWLYFFMEEVDKIPNVKYRSRISLYCLSNVELLIYFMNST